MQVKEFAPGVREAARFGDALRKPCLVSAEVIADHPHRPSLLTRHDAQARLIEPLLDKGKTVVIPSRVTNKQPREYDRDLYKARYLIENFFARLK